MENFLDFHPIFSYFMTQNIKSVAKLVSKPESFPICVFLLWQDILTENTNYRSVELLCKKNTHSWITNQCQSDVNAGPLERDDLQPVFKIKWLKITENVILCYEIQDKTTLYSFLFHSFYSIFINFLNQLKLITTFHNLGQCLICAALNSLFLIPLKPFPRIPALPFGFSRHRKHTPVVQAIFS